MELIFSVFMKYFGKKFLREEISKNTLNGVF